MVRVPLGQSADGKRIYHNRTVHGSKKDAQRYLTQVLRERDTHSFVQASQQSLSAFVDRWLEDAVSRRVRPKTLADYRSLINNHILPALGHRKLADLTTLDIAGTYTDMLRRGLSSRTVRYTHAVLRSALEEAVAWRMLAANPARLVSLPANRRKEMKALSASQASQFLAAARDDRWSCLWTLLLVTGLRPAEALGLKWQDLSEGKLAVRRSLNRLSDGSWHLTDPKTSKGRRSVTLPAGMLPLLETRQADQLAERTSAGERWKDHGFVFSTRDGEPLDYRVVVRRHFKPIARKAGLPDLRPYDLRHTCATLLLAAGENVKVVSERLGHSTATLTLDVYSHVLPDMQQRAAERLDETFFKNSSHDVIN